MKIKNFDKIIKAVNLIKKGKIVSFPTEAVYGLSCDPYNILAVKNLIRIKKRDKNKGFIIVSYSYEQVEYFIKKSFRKKFFSKRERIWPGPITMVFPKNEKIGNLITGNNDGVAIRVSSNFYIKNICKKLGQGIISTSANISLENPIRKFSEFKKSKIYKHISMIISDDNSIIRKKPTSIKNIITNKVIR